MPFQSCLPSPAVREYIECFWHASGEYGYGREKILPTGTVELLLNLSGPYKHFDVDNPTRFHWNRDAWICGLQSRYLLSEGSGKTDMLGVRFRLNGLDAFCRFSTAEFAGRVVNAESVWGTLARELVEQLHETPALPEKFALLDEFFLSKLRPHRQPLWLHVALSLLARSQGSLSIGALASSVEVSHKQLILQFRNRVGLPPKKLARVLRFNRALREIDTAGHVDWSAVALSGDYFDQAHFNKEFAQFSGLTPSAYVAALKPHVGVDIDPGDVHFVPTE